MAGGLATGIPDCATESEHHFVHLETGRQLSALRLQHRGLHVGRIIIVHRALQFQDLYFDGTRCHVMNKAATLQREAKTIISHFRQEKYFTMARAWDVGMPNTIANCNPWRSQFCSSQPQSKFLTWQFKRRGVGCVRAVATQDSSRMAVDDGKGIDAVSRTNSVATNGAATKISSNGATANGGAAARSRSMVSNWLSLFPCAFEIYINIVLFLVKREERESSRNEMVCHLTHCA